MGRRLWVRLALGASRGTARRPCWLAAPTAGRGLAARRSPLELLTPARRLGIHKENHRSEVGVNGQPLVGSKPRIADDIREETTVEDSTHGNPLGCALIPRMGINQQ